MALRYFCAAFVLLAASPAFAGLAVSFEDRDGKVIRPSDALKFEVVRSESVGGVETWTCRLESATDGERFVRIVATDTFESTTGFSVFDGLETKLAKDGVSENSVLFRRHFPLVAAWDRMQGVALALGAEDFNSFASFRRTVDVRTGAKLELVVNAALLRKGATYACTFHRLAFSPKYGVREAFARYYPLYPKRFFRNPSLDPRIYGISSGYFAWKHESAENNRLCHAEWDWCYAAGRSWGDALNQAVPTEPRMTDYSYDEGIYCGWRDGRSVKYRNAEQSVADWDRIVADRLEACRYCGVASGFYMMMLSNISKAVAKGHPDSLETHDPVFPSSYPFAPAAYAFPECSWGREARRQLAVLAEKHAFEATAFDVADSGSVYRGVRLADMSNVGFDEYGAGVVRGIANAKLFDFVRTLPVKGTPYRTAVAENNFCHHVSDCLYADLRMVESAPWDQNPPFPLEHRLMSGEKGLTLWEYGYEAFDPDYKRWPKADADQFKRDLIRFSMQRAFYAGVALPANGPLSDTEYGIRMSEVMCLCLHAGWKPVPGAKLLSDGKDEIARFGSGESAFLSVNNSIRERRRMSLEVFPSEIDTGFVGGTASDAVVFAPYCGGKAGMTLETGREEVSFIAGAQLVTVLEGVGRARGKGRFAVGWTGRPGRIALEVISKDFTGTFVPRRRIGGYVREGEGDVRLAAGERASVVYRDVFAEAAIAQTESATELVISGDAAGRDAADAVNEFLKRAGAVGLPIRKSVDGPSCSIRVGSFLLADSCQPGLQSKVRRMLDVWQSVRYPQYRTGVPLEPSEREFFYFAR